MDLDLNQEPLEGTQGPMFGLGSLLDELETTDGHIEERMRQLEAVTFRARQRQRWRQNRNPLQTVNNSSDPTTSAVQLDMRTPSGEVARETSPETSKADKRNSTHLIAKALGMDTDAKKTRSAVGNFFDCNICLDMARDPVLTRCGHLFCWPCFYHLYVCSNVKECHVCMEEVTETSIIPIYGNGNGRDNQKFKSESGLKVPPRPQAQRIESVRQQLINHGVFSSPMEERIRQFGNMLLEMRERASSQDHTAATPIAERTSSLPNSSATSQVLTSMDIESSRHQHPLQVSRFLLQGTASSFSSLSTALNSAMDSAERLVEDLEAFIHQYRLRRNRQRSSQVTDINPFSSAGIQSERQMPNVIPDVNSIFPHSATSSRRNDSAARLRLGIPRVDNAMASNSTLPIPSSSRRSNEISRFFEGDSTEINTTVPHSLSPRRRTEHPGDSDLESEFFHEPRRRRLR